MEFMLIGNVILRTIAIITVAFLVVRLRGKRQLGQLSLFDTIIIIALGSAVGDVMIYPESVVSLAYSVVAITTLALFIFSIEKIISWLPPMASKIVYGEDIVIAYQGQFIKENFSGTRLTEDQVLSRLRERGVSSLEETKIVRLEADGDLSFELYSEEKEKESMAM